MPKSEFEYLEFQNTLEELTKTGSPNIKLGLFSMFTINISSKPFYGRIIKNQFKITKNANINLAYCSIQGYFKKSGKVTEVHYEVIQNQFAKFWHKFYPIFVNFIALIALGCLISEDEDIDFRKLLSWKPILIIVLAEAFLFLVPTFLFKFKIRKFEKEFKRKMKITDEIKPN